MLLSGTTVRALTRYLVYCKCCCLLQTRALQIAAKVM